MPSMDLVDLFLQLAEKYKMNFTGYMIREKNTGIQVTLHGK